MTRQASRLIIQGRVQGVGYRWWAMSQAVRIGLDGWVRNRRDGSVELLAIGEPDAIARLAKVCGDGPPAAFVERVERLVAIDDGSVGFEQKPTR